MKILSSVLCVLSCSMALAAQSATVTPDASPVTVFKFNWGKQRVGWEQYPFSGPIENFDEMRVRARNEKRISDAKRGGNGAEVSRAESDAKTDAALVSTIHQSARPRYGFLYKILVQNNGDKIVRAIDWDYVFIDKTSQIEVGRRQFTSVQRISPGKSKELQFFIPNPPTKTISVTSLSEDQRKSLSEFIVIVRIEYLDGTIWQPAK